MDSAGQHAVISLPLSWRETSRGSVLACFPGFAVLTDLSATCLRPVQQRRCIQTAPLQSVLRTAERVVITGAREQASTYTFVLLSHDMSGRVGPAASVFHAHVAKVATGSCAS